MTNIIIFGDSITWGAFDEEKGGWVERLKLHLMSKDIDVINCGVSGDTTEDVLKRFDTEISSRKSKTETAILFAIGINDSAVIVSKGACLVNKKDFERNLLTLYARSKKFSNKVAFIGLTKVDETKIASMHWDNDIAYTSKLVRDYDSIIRKMCETKNIPYLPLYDLLASTDLNDGLHPDAAGHKKMFETIEKFLKSERII